MAQQTINVGTAPNDGTGTPLRTAFQYTNSNFSELYTAVGPSGNNIVVPGTATITGDLTVDTNTLKVDSANDAVGIGTATPASYSGSKLTVYTAANTLLTIGQVNSYANLQSNGYDFYINTNVGGAASNGGSFVIRHGSSSAVQYNIASGVHTWQNVGGVAGTAMTLNSTGLGVGLTPSGGTAGSVFSAGAVLAAGGLTANQTNRGVLGYSSNETTIRSYGATAGTGFITFRVAGGGGSGDTEAMRIDASSNVGIGVTPSAWDAGWKSIDINAVSSYSGSATGTDVWNNARVTGATSIYKTTAAASFYRQTGGVHYWFNAPSGTAGNAISFTQAMTLNANGALALQGGNTSANGVGITFPATQVASSDANTLDDYEEGNWTATLKGSVSDPTTPVTATGRYTKIGRQVSIQLFVNNVTTTGASGRIQIDGLPFANNGSVEAISNVGFYNMATFTGVPFGLTSASSTVVDMWSSVSAGVFQAVNYNPGSVQYVWVNLTYTV